MESLESTLLTAVKNYEKDQPEKSFFMEQTTADSALYEAYQLRPYNPDDIFQKTQDYSVYDEMRQDEQISAILTLKKFLILNGEWSIECEDEKIKDFLEYNLKHSLTDMFEGKLFNMLSSLDYGFSLTEKIFAYEDVPKMGKKIVLKNLKTRPPHIFEFDQDVFGNISQIRQDTDKGGDLKFSPDKFIHYIYQGEFDNPYGDSELNLGVYKCWWSKNAIIKFWNIYLERFGMPTVVGKYPQNLKKERDNILNVIKNIQSKTAIVLPEEMTVELLERSASSESGYEQAIDKYNTLIARKMLVPDLVGFSGGETSGGSFALGQSQIDMFYNNIDHETRKLARLLNKHIIQPLVVWNFGSQYEAKLIFSKPDQSQKNENMKLWLEAVKTGKVPVTDSHVNWFLKNVDAPEIDQKELDELNLEKEEMKDAIQNGQNNNDGTDEDIKDDSNLPDKKAGKDEEKESRNISDMGSKEYAAKGHFRPLTQYEKKIDFAKIETETKTIEDKYRLELSKMFKLIINGAIDDIRKKGIVEKKRFEALNKISLKHNARLEKIFRDMLTESYKLGQETKVKKFIIDDVPGLDNEDIIDWLKGTALYLSNEEMNNIEKIIKGVLTDVIRKGIGVKDAIKMLNKELEGYDMVTEGMKKSGMSAGQRMEVIARTNVSKAYNEARKQDYMKIIGEIQAFQFSAIMDGRTSALCSSLDKKIFKKDEINYYNPPLHYQCRSVLVPIFNFEEFEGFDNMPATDQEKGGFLKLKKEVQDV